MQVMIEVDPYRYVKIGIYWLVQKMSDRIRWLINRLFGMVKHSGSVSAILGTLRYVTILHILAVERTVASNSHSI